MSMSRLVPALLASVLTLACGDDETAKAPKVVVGTAPAASGKPGAAIAVTIEVENTGTAAIAARALTAAPTTSGWSGGLENAAAIEPGQKGSLAGELTPPPSEGEFDVALDLRLGGARVGTATIKVTLLPCDDGVFCNGPEFMLGTGCASGGDACDDGQACTTDSCDEATGTCSHTLGADCASCQGSCEPACEGKVCGDDGCGGTCADCPEGQACAEVSGTCAENDLPGSCRSPLPLVAEGTELLGDHVIQGDSSNGIHEAVPTCNRTSKSVEAVYVFSVTEKTGIEARTSLFDTVLHLRREDPATPASECLDNDPAATVKCSDDASPPGDYGSRIAASLDPGTYYLIVDGFDSTQYGPFELTVRFAADGCIPICDGVYCGGDDGCGGDCGDCGDGQECKAGRCYPTPCTAACDGRECGADGCGETCGTCQNGELCIEASGQCDSFPTCDHANPTCTPPCGTGVYCGTDCACHRPDDPLPDLIVNRERLAGEILVDEVVVRETSCAWLEQCVSGLGARKVLRFSVEAINQGRANMSPPPVEERPDMFHFSPCHGHYHYDGFASYELRDTSGEVVVRGRKQAYCMEDTAQYLVGPDIECNKVHDCSTQGISHGWSDLYGNALDCQWIDITDLAPGQYKIFVDLNPGHAFQESSFENNSAEVPVTIE